MLVLFNLRNTEILLKKTVFTRQDKAEIKTSLIVEKCCLTQSKKRKEKKKELNFLIAKTMSFCKIGNIVANCCSSDFQIGDKCH